MGAGGAARRLELIGERTSLALVESARRILNARIGASSYLGEIVAQELKKSEPPVK